MLSYIIDKWEGNCMPFITFTTTKTLTLNQEKALKESAGQLISILPHKKEENLMIHIEDNQVMYFRGQEMECMKISCQLFHTTIAFASVSSILYRPSLTEITHPFFICLTTVIVSPLKQPRVNKKPFIASSSIFIFRMIYS